MKYHILNGDELFKKIGTQIQGEFIVMRECLIDGHVDAETIEEFWEKRAAYIEQTYQVSKDEYLLNSYTEIEKIKSIPENASVYLWFERDLFCQVNLWFTVSFLKKILAQKNLYPFLVLPNHIAWTGFGSMSSDDLLNAYHHKITLKKKDINLFADAWRAFQQHDLEELTQLSTLAKKRYPYFPEIIQAHIDRFPENGDPNRPRKVIRKIITDLQTTDFEQVFKEFSKREGIYGFGDTQLRRIYDQEMTDNS
ncbi:DUF1835 domain-containing protein [Catalinimonas niigatensis]|uniref:DUF1835 domain-containing protein n=1 Tax=Catalinimonas niigatensis TaxID=1397264 RepID=UPI0026668783|nr:DUF1835 domain-containing protein [Catalinimonas niigatensis]WPP51073.1 DUF1835 domain-containing protein [Catalinimonas niigatensis]